MQNCKVLQFFILKFASNEDLAVYIEKQMPSNEGDLFPILGRNLRPQCNDERRRNVGEAMAK